MLFGASFFYRIIRHTLCHTVLFARSWDYKCSREYTEVNEKTYDAGDLVNFQVNWVGKTIGDIFKGTKSLIFKAF